MESTLYDIDVPGYDSGVNKLHLFDIDTVDESLVKDGISFDKNDLQVSDVISAAMAATEVKDIKIQETELSDIVKEIYRHRLSV